MLVSSTTTVKGYPEPRGRGGVPVHRCEYAHDEGKGICVTREKEGTAPHQLPREMVVVSGREGMERARH
jgi:hypothetical protein